MYIVHIILLYFIPSIHTTLNAHSLYHITSLYTVHTTPVRAHSFSHHVTICIIFIWYQTSAYLLFTKCYTTVHFTAHYTTDCTLFTSHHIIAHSVYTIPLHVRIFRPTPHHYTRVWHHTTACTFFITPHHFTHVPHTPRHCTYFSHHTTRYTYFTLHYVTIQILSSPHAKYTPFYTTSSKKKVNKNQSFCDGEKWWREREAME